jgi:hypothetical protein
LLKKNNVPGIKLNLGDYVYTLPPEALCISDDYNEKRLAISKIWNSDESNKIVLGSPWFQLFFTTLNYELNTASFGVNAVNSKN